jgi:beta-lactamase superfamily II metal-dependent hydrolase
MLHIQMFPAAHGDCLLVEYGSAKRVYRVLIDGGVARAYDTLRAQLLAIPARERRLDLLVVTHVDADHIEGIVRLLTDTTLEIRIDDVWFNGYEHLSEGTPLDFGGVQGEYLSAMIQKRKLQWNGATKGRAFCVPAKGPLPVFHLPGDLTLTLLSPSPATMAKMADAWENEVRKAGLDPAHPKEALEHLVHKGKKLIARFDEDEGPDVEALATATYKADTSPANGSSIAFLAEYKDKRILFGADAYAEVLENSIQRLLQTRGIDVLELDAFKLPHHGSRANLSAELVDMVRARKVLVSSSGALFRHPDEEAIARILKRKWPTEFVFNYRSIENEVWDHDETKKEYGYTTRYPAANETGMRVVID